MQFVQKPQVLSAVQWTGTLKSLEELTEFLKEGGHPGDIEIFSEGGKLSSVAPLNTVNTAFFQKIYIGDWLSNVNGTFMVILKEEMDQRYNPV